MASTADRTTVKPVTRRATASLNLRSARLLRFLIRAFRRTWLGPKRTPQLAELRSGGAGLESGRIEFQDGPRFFRHFHGSLGEGDLRGKEVLDVGCGFGGRTVYYAEVCGAASAHGIEVNDVVVNRCRRLADELGSSKTSFSVGLAEDIPVPDNSFDVVISFDVLEHCQDPRAAVKEIARVLRPGGKTWNVFPTYKGARSSHLAYISELPLLHRIFHPDTIIRVANEILVEEADASAPDIQDLPSWSSLGHYTLPMMNGLTLEEARRIFTMTDGLICDRVIVTPLVDPQHSWSDVRVQVGSSRAMAALVFTTAKFLGTWQRVLPLPEFLVQNIAVSATKAQPS